MEPDERIMARLKAGCLCKGVKLIRLIEAIEAGAVTFEQVAAVTGIGDGPCKGKRCRERVEALLNDPFSCQPTERDAGLLHRCPPPPSEGA